MKRFPVLTLLLAVATAAIHWTPGLTETLQFQRDALGGGQHWRVFTGHFTHFNTDHLKWDLLAFVLFGSLVEARSRVTWSTCLVAGSLVISIGIAVLQPQFTHYRGLSGLDSALFASVAIEWVRSGWRAKDWPLVGVASAGGLGFMAKTIFEFTAGQTLFVDSDLSFEPVPLAHLLGATMGALAIWATAIAESKLSKKMRPLNCASGEIASGTQQHGVAYLTKGH